MNLKDQVVVVVSDDAETSRVCVEYFRRQACREVLSFSDEDRVVEYLESGRPAALLAIDTELPHRSGMYLVPFIATGQFPAAKTVTILPLVSRLGVDDTKILVRNNVSAIVPKPVTESGLHFRLRELAQLHSESPADRNVVAQLQNLIIQGEYPEAQRLVEQELASHPGVAKYHVLYLRILLEMAQEERADQLGRKLLPKAEHYAPLSLIMAAVQVKRRNFAEAISFLERARHFAPVIIERLLLQAEMFLFSGAPLQAESRLRRAEKLCPRSEAVKAGLVRTLAALNRIEEARNLQRQMEDPSEPYQSCILRGVLLAQAGRQENAIEMYQKAMQLLIEPTKASTVLYNIALGYFKLRQYGNCKEHALRCLGASPGFERAKQLVAKAEAAQAGDAPAPACAAAGLPLTPEQLDFLSKLYFVKPSGLSYALQDGDEEEYDAEGNVVKKKADNSTIKYDNEATKHNVNIFRGSK